MTKTVTEKDLNDVGCHDFSIQTLPNGHDVLILMCKHMEGARSLMEIFRNNNYDIKVFIDESTKGYSLLFEFIDTDIAFKLETGRSETSYPPVVKLKEEKIKFITTGTWGEDSPKGRLCQYIPGVMRLGDFDIADCFRRANGVQFVAGRKPKEPSVVVLTYDDWDHILRTEADEAYNRLKDLSKSRPLMEIHKVSTDTLNIKIWDILIDLNVQIDGLQFSEEQLKKFMEETGPNDSFAFAIGFRPKGEEKAAIASTKREGFEFITLAGYSYKN
jgi:hypothetical protein